MKLDIATLVLTIAVLMLLQSFALYLNSVVNKKYQGLKFWLFGSLLETSGTFLFFVRKIESLKILSIALANIIIIFGIVVLYFGIDDISLRITIASITISLLAFIILFALLKNINQHIKTSVSFLAVIFAVYGGFFFLQEEFILFL